MKIQIKIKNSNKIKMKISENKDIRKIKIQIN